MQNKIEEIKRNALSEIEQATDLKTLEEVKNIYLSRNSEFNNLKKGMKDLSPEEKPVIGALLNKVSNELNSLFEEKKDAFYKKELNEKLLKEKIDDVEDKQTLESLEDKYRSLHEQLEKNVDGIGEYKGVTINGTIKYLTLMNREQLLSFSERVLELYSDFLKLWRKYNSDKRMLELIKRKQESLEKTLIEARATDFQIPMIPKQTDIGSADTSTKLSMLEALQHVISKIPLPKDRSVHSIKHKKS